MAPAGKPDVSPLTLTRTSDPKTHTYTSTGKKENKFRVDLETGGAGL